MMERHNTRESQVLKTSMDPLDFLPALFFSVARHTAETAGAGAALAQRKTGSRKVERAYVESPKLVREKKV